MKITVGQVLVAVGVGTYVFLGPFHGMEKLSGVRTFAADKIPYMEKLRPPKIPTSTIPKENVFPPAITVEDRMPAGEPGLASGETPFSEVPLTPVPVEPAAPAVEAPMEKAPEVKPAPAAEKPAPRRRRRSTARPPTRAQKTPVQRKAAAPQPPAKDALIGTYVALTLKTGNSVKGVLVERTSTNYKIELPGMGAFDYPANTVVQIKAAE